MSYSPAPTPIDGSVLEAIPWAPGSESTRVGAEGGAVLVSEGGQLRHTRLAHQQRPRVLRLTCPHATGENIEDVRSLVAETLDGVVPISFTHPDDSSAGVWRIQSALVGGLSVERLPGGVLGALDLTLEEVARPIPVLAASGGAVPPPGGGLPGEGGDTPPDGSPGGISVVLIGGVSRPFSEVDA